MKEADRKIKTDTVQKTDMVEKIDAAKELRLKKYMDELCREDVAVAFSGGVDSSLLLALACESAGKTGACVYAVIIHTKLHPAGDLELARKAAVRMGAQVRVMEVDELEEAGIGDNPVDRCYRCKKCFFRKMKELAGKLSVRIVMEGTNADDLLQYRPGIRALQELGIQSPLAENGLTKQEIRKMAAAYGLSAAERPSAPCLATRLPYGTKISYELLHRIDQAEEKIRTRGFRNVRIRVHGEIARIEVDKEDLLRFLQQRDDILALLKPYGFPYLTLDLEGFRSGSMDINIKEV